MHYRRQLLFAYLHVQVARSLCEPMIAVMELKPLPRCVLLEKIPIILPKRFASGVIAATVASGVYYC